MQAKRTRSFFLVSGTALLFRRGIGGVGQQRVWWSVPWRRIEEPEYRRGEFLEKKLKLVVDSITAFTYLPIRFMSYLGFVVALLGFGYAIFVVVHAFTAGTVVQGWSSLMAVVLVLGGLQMLMLGVLGEYLWRVLDESRRRPRFLIEESTPQH